MRVSQRLTPGDFDARTARELQVRDQTAGLEEMIVASPDNQKRGRFGKPSGKKIGRALQAAGKNLNVPEDTLSLQHEQAVSAGNQMRAGLQTSRPGRAQEIIKKRRI